MQLRITTKKTALNTRVNLPDAERSAMARRIIPSLALASLALVCVVLAGCTGVTPVQPAPSETQVLPDSSPGISSEDRIIEANNRFASDLYSRLENNPAYAGSNLFFSPFSISSAVAIAYEGARGTTADEIRSAFYFPENMTTLREGYSGVISGINRQDAGYTLRTSNALWAEKTYPFLPDYTHTAGRWYAANTTNLDFVNAPEASRNTINRWTEEKTENKIRDLLPAGSIHPLTRLVITDAVYFKGTWVRPFDTSKTRDADFRIAPGKTVQVPMMEKTDPDAVYAYAETGDVQFIQMPYTRGNGTRLSMLVLLPRVDDIAAADRYLDPRNLSELQNASTYRRVMVYFPKFTLETKYSLPPVLASMGMHTAFSDNADFSGMDGTTYLSIEEIVHKAYVSVNEEGTEAAAATAIAMTGKGLPSEGPVPVFRADHPFLFLIQDQETGTILFLGRVVNPKG